MTWAYSTVVVFVIWRVAYIFFFSAFIVGPSEPSPIEEVGVTDSANGPTPDGIDVNDFEATEEIADEDGRTNEISEEFGGADISFEEVGAMGGIDINNFKGKIVRKDHGKKII